MRIFWISALIVKTLHLAVPPPFLLLPYIPELSLLQGISSITSKPFPSALKSSSTKLIPTSLSSDSISIKLIKNEKEYAYSL